MEPLLQKDNKWSFTRRTWFLFIVIYFSMLVLDFTSSDELYPHFIYEALKFYTNFWNWMVPWTGKHILHLSYPITVTPNGSGDTTYNYVLQLLWIVFALLIAFVWALADRKRSSYNQLRYWIRIVLRYYLALTLFVYGFDKIIKLQFPYPSLYRLTETYGDSSPMGLAWTFLGYSKGYNYFTGGAEVLAGCLLFFKRTTLFGSLVAMTVMSNIVAMNFAYDIPVKIFSTNLLILAGWLACHDINRIVNVFFLNKPAPAADLGMPLKTKWKKILQTSLKVAAILFAFYATLWASWKNMSVYGEDAPKGAWYGIYDTEVFVKNRDTLPPLMTDSIRWKRAIVNYAGYMRIVTMTDSRLRESFTLDTLKSTVHFVSLEDSTKMFTLNYKTPDAEHLLLEGRINNDSVSIIMKRFNPGNSILMGRGFHWINEEPFNR